MTKKHSIFFIAASACLLVLLTTLSFWIRTLYLADAQDKAAHLMRFADSYLTEERSSGKPLGLNKEAAKLASLTGNRTCFFSSSGEMLADSIPTGQDKPALYFPLSRIRGPKELVTSSVSNQDGRYVVNEFYPIQLTSFTTAVLCMTVPLDALWKIHIIQFVMIGTGAAFFLASLILWKNRKDTQTARENEKPRLNPSVRNHIDQMKYYYNERINLLSTVLTNTESGILFFDADGFVLLMNPKAQHLTGAKSSLFFPKHRASSDWVSPVFSHVQAMARESMQQKKPQKEDLPTADGRIFFIRTTVVYSKYVPYTFSGIQVFITDVTEKRRMERIRDEFVSNVSHELRTPLTLICGFTETLQNRQDLDDEDCQHALEIIGIESNRLRHMISQLLDLSHMESRIDAGHLSPVDPIEAVEPLCASFIVLAEKKNITFSSSLPHLGRKIFGDKTSLAQIVTNLCENAIKYTQDGGKVTLSAQANDRDFIFQVKDNGIGMDQSEIPHVFERFYRVEKSRNTKRGGSGLGLAITKELVDELGGRISVYSKLNEGSTFTVRFPVTEEKAQPEE
ncbi:MULTISPECIES: ATP-binding protein [Caproicibacterium]|jgi:two-component system phosphate regulon sensor histidine kinase PhoR|uniref:histidine kinase n=2 Tax=Caproicibacterium lactatifermentans TaxID=2666138 RepID=A0A859DM57_9FIRM|nr:ATP-binding protein [Caproicibacterium lactatifermentans]ARP49474.1 hypothetical protein B6259_00345 [Ruminococcaceae bacterium CPB6]MDD4806875.1 ATP-binding protein [Oscillospiraceae bacterium]QKN23067.1 PAS domain S-box protein [Caproicibacterium lactatifermentans]QKO30327.1 PAS domain S-box protein [Caproicibacterium lactatifermentans]